MKRAVSLRILLSCHWVCLYKTEIGNMWKKGQGVAYFITFTRVRKFFFLWIFRVYLFKVWKMMICQQNSSSFITLWKNVHGLWPLTHVLCTWKMMKTRWSARNTLVLVKTLVKIVTSHTFFSFLQNKGACQLECPYSSISFTPNEVTNRNLKNRGRIQ